MIERLKELEAKATPGPWKVDLGNWEIERDHAERHVVLGITWQERQDQENQTYWNMAHPYADMELIAELRNALPKLLAAMEAADTLAIHVSGILALKAVGTPETTKGWLENYLQVRGKLDEP